MNQQRNEEMGPFVLHIVHESGYIWCENQSNMSV